MDYVDRNDRYNILFEPVTIGPVKSKNRFYQVPHCNGGGYRDPSAAAEMRGIKSQGGWGVIFTEQCEMHHTSEITPFIELRLWDDSDIPMIAKMADRMKEFGALAGIQLAYSHNLLFRLFVGLMSTNPVFLLINLSQTKVLYIDSFYYEYSYLSIFGKESTNPNGHHLLT